jgi:hypothetical protein
MKRNLPSRILLAAWLLTAATAAHAAPLQRADVIHEPLWVLHVDADALRPTVIGQHLLTEMEKPEAQQKFAAFQAIFSFDPRRELHGLTLYGASKAEEDGVLLAYADFDAARLTTLAEGAKDHKSSAHRQYTIHNWIDEKKKEKQGGQPRTYAAIHGGRVVVFAQKESRVAEALDVLDRAKPNLATNLQFPKLGPGPAFIQGVARKLELPANDPNAAVFKQSKLVTLSVSEIQRKLQAVLTLETDSEEVAQQVESIGRGLVGLLALQKDKPEAQKLAQGLAVQQDGAAVTVKLSILAEEVVGMMKAGAAKKAAKE